MQVRVRWRQVYHKGRRQVQSLSKCDKFEKGELREAVVRILELRQALEQQNVADKLEIARLEEQYANIYFEDEHATLD